MNDVFQKIVTQKKGGQYDVAVMYSGGKDSSYLIYLLQEVYHLRVMAVMVDNGFEHDYTWEPMRRFPEEMGVPLQILHPDKEMFIQLFRMLVTEYPVFQKNGINHVCFICNNILWCEVAKYAFAHDIPYIASGLSLMQLSSGRSKPLEPDLLANSIAERSTRMIYKNAVEGMKQTQIFQENADFRDFILSGREAIKNVTTVYPYIYHSVSIREQKETLTKLNWQPPSLNSVEKYISSGCKVMQGLIYELEKLGIITLNEREQAKVMMQKGLMEGSDTKFATYDASKDIVNVGGEVITQLQLQDFLIGLCEKEGRAYQT